MKKRTFCMTAVILLWIAAPSFAADNNIGSPPGFSCDETTYGVCECHGYIDCKNLLDSGLCRDHQGVTMLCCTLDGAKCDCKKGGPGDGKCPAGTKPFDPNPNTKPRTGPEAGGSETTDPGTPPTRKPPTSVPPTRMQR